MFGIIGVFNHNTLKCNNDYIFSKKGNGIALLANM